MHVSPGTDQPLQAKISEFCQLVETPQEEFEVSAGHALAIISSHRVAAHAAPILAAV